MPARRIEVLPRPDWPKRIVRSLRCTRRASSATSSSRPWKKPRVSSVNESRPSHGFCGVDRWQIAAAGWSSGGIRARRLVRERAASNSCRRRDELAASTRRPAARVKCTARNLSGTLRVARSFVSSMHTGRMNIAPSAMLRVRSIA